MLSGGALLLLLLLVVLLPCSYSQPTANVPSAVVNGSVPVVGGAPNQNGSISGPSSSSVAPSSPLTGCAAGHNDCGLCTSQWQCVYCTTSGQCIDGMFYGPYNSSAASSNCDTWQWRQCSSLNGFVFMILVGSASGAVLLFVSIGLICCCCCRGKPKREPLPLEAAYGQRDDSKRPLLSSSSMDDHNDDGYGPSPSNHPKTDARRAELAQKYGSLRASQRSN